jgi:hypothetical protein
VEEIEGGGGIGLFSAGGFDVSGFEGVIETAYPREGCGGLAIEIQSSLYRKKKYKLLDDPESRTGLYSNYKEYNPEPSPSKFFELEGKFNLLV